MAAWCACFADSSSISSLQSMTQPVKGHTSAITLHTNADRYESTKNAFVVMLLLTQKMVDTKGPDNA